MIVNLLKAGLGILDVLYRFGNFFRVGKLMALSICCFLGGLILVRLFTVPYFFPEIVEIERVLPLMAAILIFSCTESNLGKSIIPDTRPLGTSENQDGHH